MALPGSYVFPAVFFEDEVDKGMYNVRFPDLPECFTCGKNLADAIEMASDALGLCMYMAERDKRPIPAPSRVADVKLQDGEFCQLVPVSMAPVRKAWRQRPVRKTLTIPSYLAALADEAKVNYSLLLQNALRQELHVQ